MIAGARAKARQVIERLGGSGSRLERRVSRMLTSDLVLWVESSTAGIGKAFNDWQHDGAPESLDEARMGTAALLVALEELESRRAAGQV